MVDFPDPEGPTMAILCPELAEKVIPCRTG